MAKYRDYSPDQGRWLPVSLPEQVQPGTFEYTINYLVDHKIDLGVFDCQYRNDMTGAPAIHPAALLKVVLLAYSRGTISSRRIAACCEENTVFMALSADTRPHFSTIAHFISSMGDKILSVFRDVLIVCYAESLIGRTMFAVDGCKLSANCAKEWSGTKRELEKKAAKIEEAVTFLLKRHREEDELGGSEPTRRQKEEKTIRTLDRKADKIRKWLSKNEERIGAEGKPVKSNLTDPESAKMPSSHGVIQGYTGIATVDDKHQVVVDAEAFGDGNEAGHLVAVLESVRETFATIEPDSNILKEVVVTADSGYHSEKTVKALLDDGVDAYIADKLFRKRDPRFAESKKGRRPVEWKKRKAKVRKQFPASEFVLDEVRGELRCPAGKWLKVKCENFHTGAKGFRGVAYTGREEDCLNCPLRSRCIRKPEKTKVRQVAKLLKGSGKRTFSQRMVERFDSERGRGFYSRRMGTVEPVFGNVRQSLGLDHFTLRGRAKVDTQWKLYCTVHNIGKLRSVVARYGRN